MKGLGRLSLWGVRNTYQRIVPTAIKAFITMDLVVGQKAGFLATALQQFKAGEWRAPMMAKLLRTWTSEDVNNVAACLSGLRLMRACGDSH